MKVGTFGEGYGDNVFLGTEIIIIATGRPVRELLTSAPSNPKDPRNYR